MKRKRKKLFRVNKKDRYVVAYIHGMPVMYKSNQTDEVTKHHGFIAPVVDKTFSKASDAWEYLKSWAPETSEDWDESADCLWWYCHDS